MTTQAGIVLRHLRGLLAVEAVGSPADRQLLERFTADGDEAAFAALVGRHGPMVLGVCHRLLGEPHDAEDAFQATFLTLVRKAHSITRHESVGGWLYRVAYRTSLHARAGAAERQFRERRTDIRTVADPLDELTGRELLSVLDEEVQSLPDSYRAPLVLCYLEGKTRDEAARQLGWSLGTLKRRLEQGRERLRTRLGRRGLSLPAALLALGAMTAALPGTLAASTARAARLLAAGQVAAVSEAVTRLVQQSLPAMAAGKWKAVGLLLLVLGLVAAGAGLAASGVPAQEKRAADGPRVVAKTDAENQERTVAGRVLDPDGKPLAGAEVAVLAWQALYVNSDVNEDSAWQSNRVAARTRSAADGTFRLKAPQIELRTICDIHILAAAGGYGLAHQRLGSGGEAAAVELRLVREQVVRGRILDLQGAPAAGARVCLTRLAGKQPRGERFGGWLEVPPDGLPFGPMTATADARGDFAIRGLGDNLNVELDVRDERVACRGLRLDTGERQRVETVRLTLPPARFVEGRVTFEDTGKPAANVRVAITQRERADELSRRNDAAGRTDAAGHYRLNIPFTEQPPGEEGDFSVVAFPPAGEPYWLALRPVAWPRGAQRQRVDLALPRGVLVRGRITEAGSGKPVAGAWVQVNGRGRHQVESAADGSFRLGVPAGAKWLTAIGPTPDYIPQVLGSAEVLNGKPGGTPLYYHAVAPLGLNAGDKTKEVSLELRRGVTLRGHLRGPDGKPVDGAVMLAGSHRVGRSRSVSPAEVRGGQFELRGCDPAKVYRLHFLKYSAGIGGALLPGEAPGDLGHMFWIPTLPDRPNRWGATVEVPGGPAAKAPLEVRLAPCGSAKVRFLDAAGKPLIGHRPWLQVVVTPGPPPEEALRLGKLAAEAITLSRMGIVPDIRADGRGEVLLEGLIPGAAYRLRDPETYAVLKDFTAEPGKTAELEITVK